MGTQLLIEKQKPAVVPAAGLPKGGLYKTGPVVKSSVVDTGVFPIFRAVSRPSVYSIGIIMRLQVLLQSWSLSQIVAGSRNAFSPRTGRPSE